MEPAVPPVDVCIVCALTSSGRAFLEVVRPYCEGEIEEQSSSHYQYSYRIATIKTLRAPKARAIRACGDV